MAKKNATQAAPVAAPVADARNAEVRAALPGLITELCRPLLRREPGVCPKGQAIKPGRTLTSCLPGNRGESIEAVLLAAARDNEGPLTTAQIEARSGANAVGPHMTYLAERGFIESPRRGLYALTSAVLALAGNVLAPKPIAPAKPSEGAKKGTPRGKGKGK